MPARTTAPAPDTNTPTPPAAEADAERTIRAVNAPPADVAPLPAHPDPSTPNGGRAAPAGVEGEGADEAADALGALISPDVIAGGVSALFDAVAVRRGDHWHLQDGEAENIAEPLAEELRGLAERAPFLVGAADAVGGNRLRLIMAIGFAVGPRVILDRQIARERADAGIRERAAARPEPSGTAARDTSADELDPAALATAGMEERDPDGMPVSLAARLNRGG
ncbi:MAG: hypothetical protein AMXMBFR23_03430 [Chloroflexota bacterium]